MNGHYMKILLKIATVLAIVIMSFVTHACATTDKTFNVTEWHKSIVNINPERLYAPHYKDGLYFNPWNKMQKKGLATLLAWKLSSKREYTKEEKEFSPQVIQGAKERIKLTKSDFIMWVGHNTFLLRINGIYWITDPIFSEKAFIVQRKTRPGLSVEDLKDVTNSINIIITHNHYDHLDEDSIKAMPAQGNDFVPKGIKKFFHSSGRKNVEEMDWWQEIQVGKGVKLICLPAQHWSKRLGQSDNTTLWASYMLITSKHTFYIGGDSGYFPGYKEFGKKFKKIDYAFLPTTAYHPRWFMHYNHMNVKEALMAFKELGAQYFIPTQWGTFPLGDEPIGYPALDLQRQIKEQKLDKKRFFIMDIGEIIKN